VRGWLRRLGVVALLGATVVYGHRAARMLEADRRAAEVTRVAELVRAGQLRANALVPWVRALREASEMDPTSLRVLAARGDLFLLVGRDESAVEAYDEALALEPRAEVYFNRSLALEQLGRDREAALDRERALVLDPRLERRPARPKPKRRGS